MATRIFVVSDCPKICGLGVRNERNVPPRLPGRLDRSLYYLNNVALEKDSDDLVNLGEITNKEHARHLWIGRCGTEE
jgi:hypothetical protein